ncbi:MAG: glycine--tRNA ligase subunit beta [Bacillota bacterium]|nr:glycine--tRNA ligase subunit beta [Bacillota bacterium]
MTKTADLLFEIGCEEIPSRFMAGALEQLKTEAAALLADNRLEHGDIETWGTPRRLVMVVGNLETAQPDLVETVKGPPLDRAYDEDGKPTKALTGFMQGQGVSIDQVGEEVIKNARYVVIQKEIAGRPTANLLTLLLPRLIQKLNFPRPMYWQGKDIRFARPIRWLLALYDNREIHFEYAGVTSGKFTLGHRFLTKEPLKINDIESYFKTLEENFVVVSQDKRREIIRKQLEQKAAEKGGKALIDPDLLEEVIHLVEYPVAVDGYFDEAYLDLPQEVLITTMQHHQRYFPILEEDGSGLLPYFVGISNNRFHENIRKGYAKVLQARLADARFFFNEDRKQALEDYVEQLSSVIFLESLGTLDQKRDRLVQLTEKLGKALSLPRDQIEAAQRAAHLCKADLVTSLVKEFTELQGVMGREYARLSGETEEVAVSIYEHYLPRFSGDDIPAGMVGALVSLADRIDTLAGCFAIGIQPTGSQDPYALRRQAQGAVSIMLGKKLDLSIADFIGIALNNLTGTLNLTPKQVDEISGNLTDFITQRIRFALQEQGITFDVIEAVLAVPFNSIYEMFNRAVVLDEYVKGPLLDDVVIAYNRVANLAGKTSGGVINENLFVDDTERELYHSMLAVETAIEGNGDTAHSLEELQTLKPSIDNLFDSVMIMVEDRAIRDNRLNLLARIKALFNRVADFSRLQTP